jgi:hypothetical protein
MPSWLPFLFGISDLEPRAQFQVVTCESAAKKLTVLLDALLLFCLLKPLKRIAEGPTVFNDQPHGLFRITAHRLPNTLKFLLIRQLVGFAALEGLPLFQETFSCATETYRRKRGKFCHFTEFSWHQALRAFKSGALLAILPGLEGPKSQKGVT